jgi:hypothetical protein
VAQKIKLYLEEDVDPLLAKVIRDRGGSCKSLYLPLILALTLFEPLAPGSRPQMEKVNPLLRGV